VHFIAFVPEILLTADLSQKKQFVKELKACLREEKYSIQAAVNGIHF
jgi:hypothetical protein